MTYRERLSPSPAIFLASALLLPAMLLILAPISIPAGIVAAIVVFGGACLLLVVTSPVVEVRDGELRAGKAHIPLRFTGGGEPFRKEAATAARGVDLDARAYLCLRGWIDPVARIRITDPDDPTPYWVVSTRHPEELLTALLAAQREAEADAG